MRAGGRALVGLLLLCGCGTVAPGPPVEVDVPPGSSLASVSDSLVARGVISHPTWFRLRGRLAGVDRRLQPGRYSFDPGEGAQAILDRLARGQALVTNLTLPEGATLWDLARAGERRLGLSPDSIWAAARDASLRQRFGIEAATVEGWLLPETFGFGRYATARDVVRRFIGARQDAWSEQRQQLAARQGLSHAAVLTLASIVEAEAQVGEELPIIAAVYRNRMRLGMPLQADPTIQYAFLVDSGSRRPRLFNRDYAYPSPYNTYLHAGLPPTPIGNPSTAAIDAVLSPANTAVLYFVARGDGRHQFANSYGEHLRNIRRIRAGR